MNINMSDKFNVISNYLVSNVEINKNSVFEVVEQSNSSESIKKIIDNLNKNSTKILTALSEQPKIEKERIKAISVIIKEYLDNNENVNNEIKGNSKQITCCKEIQSFLNALISIEDIKNAINEGDTEKVLEHMKVIESIPALVLILKEVNPYSMAIKLGNKEMVDRFLMERSLSNTAINYPSVNPPIIQALEAGNFDIAKLIVEKGRIKWDLDKPNNPLTLSLPLLSKLEPEQQIVMLDLMIKASGVNEKEDHRYKFIMQLCRQNLSSAVYEHILDAKTIPREFISKYGHLFLMEAVRKNDDGLVDNLLKFEFNINSNRDDNKNALYIAAANRNVSLFDKLILHGADLSNSNIKDLSKEMDKLVGIYEKEEKSSSLHEFGISMEMFISLELLEDTHKVKENIKRGKISSLDLDSMKFITSQKSKEFLIATVNPFKIAINNDDIELISMLLEDKELVELVNIPKEEPPIMQALYSLNFTIAKKLISNDKVELNILDKRENTPLSLCQVLSFGFLDILPSGSKAEDNDEVQTLEGGDTTTENNQLTDEEIKELDINPEEMDIEKSALQILQMIKNKVNYDSNTQQGYTYRIHICRRGGDLSLYKEIFNPETAPAKLMYEYGHLFLFEAIKRDDNVLIEAILKCNININAVDEKGENALFKAIAKKNYYLVEQFLLHGADVNNNISQNTPLYRAMLAKDLKMVDLLLKYGADPTLQVKKGRLSHFHMFKVLKTKYPNISNEIGETFITTNKNVKDVFRHEVLLKKVAHAFEMKGKGKLKYKTTKKDVDIDLEGMPGMKAGATMLKRIGKMLEQGMLENEKILADEEISEIKKLIATSKETPEKMMELIQKGESVIIPSGYEKHAAFFLIWNGMIIHCDRSVQKGQKVMHLYHFDKNTFNLESLKEMMHGEKERVQYSKMVSEMETKWGLKPLPISDSIEQSCILQPQKVGNCTFANSITVVNAILMMMAIENNDIDLLSTKENKSSIVSMSIAKSQDKMTNLIRWIQVELIEEYLQETMLGENILFEPDHELIHVAFGLAWEANKGDPSGEFATKIINLELKYIQKLDPENEKKIIEDFFVGKTYHRIV